MIPTLFYGVPSGCSFGSIVALEWLGEPYRLSRVEMPADVTSETYRRINPVAETPALMLGNGRVISESMAIMNHLGWLGIGKGLGFPQGSDQFDLFNQVLAYLNTSLFNGFSPLWYALEHESDGSSKDALRTYGATLLAKAHADLEEMLRGKKWLLGERRTLADAYFAGIARWTKYHDVLDRRDYPAVQNLFERLEDDPGVRFAHAIERGEKSISNGGFRGEVSLKDALHLRQQAS
ncbi:glutathione S-transferase family protein [Phyllobacterium endophyticum]|uniref:Glutathione S-transferase n=1 Tax=Phyllobacterium endophyticum TaxID=1149773 RepID=A0A2P7AP90_9HYPH|nr:glutathione S-transferase family protein [Phyllobacterium endophyticum]PSH56014.1 glutathione S-transferase [Phyllobacterium endophyticum]TYR41162.1 glutathione S-transferase family protein [Phyllobacterium endophyticum]